MMASATKAKRRTRTKAPGVYRSVSGRYEIAYRDSDGRQVFKTLPTGTTFEQAKAQRAEKVTTLAKGGRIRSVQPTFGSYADALLESLDAPASTVEKHHYHLRTHLKPRFGTRRLDQIDVDGVAKLVAAMKRPRPGGKPAYKGSTIAGTLATLSFVMNKAVRVGYAQVNPVRLLDKDERPKLQATEKRALGGEEIESVLGRAGDTFRPIVATMVFTGLRMAEVLGLRWEDIDRKRGYVHVRGQLTRTRERTEHGKTASAHRSVVLIHELDALLLEHRMCSPYKASNDYVFTTPDGRPRGHRTTSRGIQRALTRAGLSDGLSPHNFRHTFASHMIVGMKEDAVTVSRMIGHKKPSFTQDVYSHLFDEAKHDEERRRRYSEGYGKHLRDVNEMSTSGRNGTKIRTPDTGQKVATIG